jgi:FkbM family methyltransferase
MSAVETLIIDGNGSLSDKFLKMQKDFGPDYAIEVGAHAAEFSLAISNNLAIDAVAFEAGSAVYEKFKDQANSDLVKYLNYAISDKDGFEIFTVAHNEYHGNNSIISRTDKANIKTEEVKSYKLDTYFKDADFKKACLWIDAEGANEKVLTGAVETLKKVHSVFIETEDYAHWENQWLTLDVVKFLNSHGFMVLDHETVYGTQHNIIFVRSLNDN